MKRDSWVRGWLLRGDDYSNNWPHAARRPASCRIGGTQRTRSAYGADKPCLNAPEIAPRPTLRRAPGRATFWRARHSRSGAASSPPLGGFTRLSLSRALAARRRPLPPPAASRRRAPTAPPRRRPAPRPAPAPRPDGPALRPLRPARPRCEDLSPFCVVLIGLCKLIDYSTRAPSNLRPRFHACTFGSCRTKSAGQSRESEYSGSTRAATPARTTSSPVHTPGRASPPLHERCRPAPRLTTNCCHH